MDPQLRWLRRFVIARAAERLAAEAAIVGLSVGVGAGTAGWPPIDVLIGAAIGVAGFVVLRLGSAIATNPINHRYLLRWTDPTARLRVSAPASTRSTRPATGSSGRTGPGGPVVDDPIDAELDAGGFRYMARLVRSDAVEDDGDRGHAGAAPTLDLYRAEGGRLVVVRTDDRELTVISGLDDGRTLVTAPSLVPPTEQLIVQRGRGGRGQIATDIVLDHVERLMQLRDLGVDARATEPADVVAVLHAEWSAWQDIGPFIGALIAVSGRRRFPIALQVELPDDLVRARFGTLPGHRGRDAKPGAEAPTGTTHPRPQVGVVNAPTN